MLQSILNGQITKAERELGVPLDYVRYVASVSYRSLWRLMKFTRLTQPRRSPYLEAQFVASIVAAQADDCGSCVQIGVNLARKAGMKRDVIRAVVDHQPERLSEELRDVYHFADAVLTNSAEQDALRGRVQEHFGSAGLVEISMAIAMYRVYPTLKRALGFATSCARVTVEA
jgi:AhpD family alkylhydroperoxidase